ncbi:glyoxalase [Herbidospora sp. NEAU-GS84]|uniref:Glyoxalase n=1 Tax=Herbidospora solisilvae TaxID=2696284 RepID=A0A7C9NBF1_9ACTN|nr:VOC family protein [Herbidospora solisilvae]NAS26553.1 glyoxalase [Herbidospora solisilvae]
MTVIPTIRYHDADKALAWLTSVLGFTSPEVYRSDDGVIVHARLSRGNGMVMLGSVGHGLDVVTGPASTYVVVDDLEIDALYEIAKAAGVEVIRELRSEDYGGRGYTIRDPEGHVWSVGSYDPVNTA